MRSDFVIGAAGPHTGRMESRPSVLEYEPYDQGQRSADWQHIPSHIGGGGISWVSGYRGPRGRVLVKQKWIDAPFGVGGWRYG